MAVVKPVIDGILGGLLRFVAGPLVGRHEWT